MIIEEAVEFAKKAHEGAVRKGTAVPYIVHPVETALIVALMTTDEEMVAAALLHDVVEDTPVTEEEIRSLFGERIASLVHAESEDKSKSWWERKQEKIRKAAAFYLYARGLCPEQPCRFDVVAILGSDFRLLRDAF